MSDEILPFSMEKWKTVVVAGAGQPAIPAGQEWSVAVPVRRYWLLKGVTASFQQGATGSPQPVLVLGDNNGVTWAEGMGATAAQGAVTTCLYTWAPGMVLSGIQGSGADQHAQAPLPANESCFLPPAYTISSHTIGLGALGQYLSVVLFVMEDGI